MSSDRRPSFAIRRTINSNTLNWKQSRRDRLSKISADKNYKLEHLQISSQTIKFLHKGGHSQYVYSRDLKLNNKTGTRIGYKIKSNNPQNYEVMPCQGKIQNGQSCEIRIRLFVQVTKITKYWMDKFLVEWGILDELTNQPIFSQKSYLNVEVSTDISKVKVENMNQNIVTSQKDIIFYEEIIQKNKLIIAKLQKQIIVREEAPKPWIISYSMGVFLAFLAFLLGYFIY